MFLFALAAATSILTNGSVCSNVPYFVDEFTAVYGSDPATQSVDVYLPDDVAREPLIVFVHGGAWVSGDKSQYSDLADTFARCGVGFAVVNYTIGPDSHAGQQAADVAAAFKWLHDLAGSRSFDGRRMFLMGHSSGAQLAAYVEAGGTHVLAASGLDERDLAGVIAMDGTGYDLSAETHGVALNPFRLFAFGRAFGGGPDEWKPYDIAQYLTGKEPPTLVIHGELDVIAPEFESAYLAASLQSAGDSVTYLQVPDRDHFSVLKNVTQGAGDPVLEAILHFVLG